MEYRDTMRNNDQNLGWCKPLYWEAGNVILVINENAVAGIQISGKSIAVTPANIRAAAKLVNSSYSDFTQYSDTSIILDCADEAEELPCRRCPWFDACDAMDEEIFEAPEYNGG